MVPGACLTRGTPWNEADACHLATWMFWAVRDSRHLRTVAGHHFQRVHLASTQLKLKKAGLAA